MNAPASSPPWLDRPEWLQPVPLPQAYRLINHGPTVLVSTARAGRFNVMAAAWNMPLDFNPPKVAVVVDRQTLTREWLEASGEFVLNVPVVGQAEAVRRVGSETGREVDKWQGAGLQVHGAAQVQAPLVAGCVAWLECRLLPEAEVLQRHDLVLAEVVAAWADSRAYAGGRWLPLQPHQHMLHHIAGGEFFQTGSERSVPGVGASGEVPSEKA
jgi:flavin reductase (DIM6/NTAB) family NADH-FMN oxidoreductase RutF